MQHQLASVRIFPAVRIVSPVIVCRSVSCSNAASAAPGSLYPRSLCGRLYQAGVEFFCSALTNFPLLSAPLLCHSRHSTIRSCGGTGRWCCRLGFRKIYHDEHAMQPVVLSVLDKCVTYHSEGDLHDAAEEGVAMAAECPKQDSRIYVMQASTCDWVRRLDLAICCGSTQLEWHPARASWG